MTIQRVDPRDVDWETSDPDFRVYFTDVDNSTSEFEFVGETLHSVMAWAEAHRAGQRYDLYAVVDVSNRRGLVRLLSE